MAPKPRQVIRKYVRNQPGRQNYQDALGARPRVAEAAKALGPKKTKEVIRKTNRRVAARRGGGGGGEDQGFGGYVGAGFATTSNIGMQGKAFKAKAEGFSSGFGGESAGKSKAVKEEGGEGRRGRGRGRRPRKPRKPGGSRPRR